MERWLSMQLAQRLGGGRTRSFLFPRALIESARVRGGVGEKEDVGAKYQPETLLWAIAALLPDFFRTTRSRPSELLGQGRHGPVDGPFCCSSLSVSRDVRSVRRVPSGHDGARVETVEGSAGLAARPVAGRLVARLGDGHLAREQRFSPGSRTRRA